MQDTSSGYTKAKEIFSDVCDDDYVNLDSSVVAYDKILEVLDKPIKLSLLFGKPGTGKTFLLKKIYSDLSKKKSIIFIPAPFFSESEFIKYIYKESFGEEDINIDNFDQFFNILKSQKKDAMDAIPILVDEAQLYPEDILEKIRLLADTRKYKIIFTVHKTDQKEDIFAKDYFKTRIWESIELSNISYDEFKIYVEKKFLYHNMFEFINRLSKDQYKMIYNFSDGNLRKTNKILYKLFEICEYYDIVEPSKIGSTKIDTKFLEMTAISLGYINA